MVGVTVDTKNSPLMIIFSESEGPLAYESTVLFSGRNSQLQELKPQLRKINITAMKLFGGFARVI